MSDSAYSSFLDQANQDTSGAKTSSAPSSGLKTTNSKLSIPSALSSLSSHTYESDSDEPFEPVALSFTGKTLTPAAFGKLVGHSKGEVEELSVKEWDPKGRYGKVVDAVKGAVEDQDVKVFRAETEGARVEYFVVGLDGEGNVVGARARAVES